MPSHIKQCAQSYIVELITFNSIRGWTIKLCSLYLKPNIVSLYANAVGPKTPLSACSEATVSRTVASVCSSKAKINNDRDMIRWSIDHDHMIIIPWSWITLVTVLSQQSSQASSPSSSSSPVIKSHHHRDHCRKIRGQKKTAPSNFDSLIVWKKSKIRNLKVWNGLRKNQFDNFQPLNISIFVFKVFTIRHVESLKCCKFWRFESFEILQV